VSRRRHNEFADESPVTILWFILSERGSLPLPALVIDTAQFAGDAAMTIGSAVDATVRLPAGQGTDLVNAQHLALWCEIDAADQLRFSAIGDVQLASVSDAAKSCHQGDVGILKLPAQVTIARWQIGVEAGTREDSKLVSPLRTASLARELARGLLSGNNAPALSLHNSAGLEISKRELPPPEVRITIGRGDEADWQIADDDLSRLHVAVFRGWDGVRVFDLQSKNGTRHNGKLIAAGETAVAGADAGALLKSGDVIAIGQMQLRFTDPAERAEQVLPADKVDSDNDRRGATSIRKTSVTAQPGADAAGEIASHGQHRSDRVTFWLALAISVIAGVAAIWLVIAGLGASPVDADVPAARR
jgi:hypothetical protein